MLRVAKALGLVFVCIRRASGVEDRGSEVAWTLQEHFRIWEILLQKLLENRHIHKTRQAGKT